MRDRLKRRMFPLLASIGLLLAGMFTTTLGPTWTGKAEWALPYDLWGTLIATVRLAGGNVGGLYTRAARSSASRAIPVPRKLPAQRSMRSVIRPTIFLEP
jgi:hypothetical protein